MSAYRTDKDITLVYEKFVNTVYKVCYVLLKNEAETEDVVQNVFIKYMKIDKEFESDEHIKAWLIVCAKNECKNLLKHWWRTKKVSMESVGDVASDSEHPMDETLEKVMKLPDKYKIPIYLHYYEGYSTEEISKMLGVNHSTLRGRLSTAREKLKHLLKGGSDIE